MVTKVKNKCYLIDYHKWGLEGKRTKPYVVYSSKHNKKGVEFKTKKEALIFAKKRYGRKTC